MSGLISLLTGFLILITLNSALSDDAKLETFVAQSIINEKLKEPGRKSLEGSIIGYLSNVEKGPASPLKAWKYAQGRLVDATMEEYRAAVGNDRSQWPHFTFSFRIKSATPVSARVEIDTLFDVGILPPSRGGHSEEWTLEMRSGNWMVVSKRTMMFWD